jgi:hypothetical protein
MMFGHLFKKGTMHTATNGSIVILNEDKVAYPVNKADAAVWSQCTGITFEQLRDVISSKLGWQIPPDVLSHLERFVNWCVWAKLIEVRDFTQDHFADLMRHDSLDKGTSEKLVSIATEEIEPLSGTGRP